MHFFVSKYIYISDKNNCQYLGGIPEHYRAIIWEFENSIMDQNFSIINKCLMIRLFHLKFVRKEKQTLLYTSPCMHICDMPT